MAVRTERNLQIELVIALVVVLAGVWLRLTVLEWMVVCVAMGLVLAAELCNSALEHLADLYTQEPDDNVRRIKDMAAGAVLVAAVSSGVIGLLLFGSRLGNW